VRCNNSGAVQARTHRTHLGVFTFVATKCVGFALRDILSLTQIHEETEKQIAAISQETEDVLDTRSLAVLAESHDGATRELYGQLTSVTSNPG
jgi:hypothetical protein